MSKIRLIYMLIPLILFTSACTNNSVENSDSNDQVHVEQSSFQNDKVMNRSDIADHLSNLALKTSGVEDAAAIVAGPYTVVGIDINENVDRKHAGPIKHSVSEAVQKDSYGKQAVVIADGDIIERLRGMRDSIQEGKPVKGIAEELANIISRYVPTMPTEDYNKNNTQNSDTD